MEEIQLIPSVAGWGSGQTRVVSRGEDTGTGRILKDITNGLGHRRFNEIIMNDGPVYKGKGSVGIEIMDIDKRPNSSP